MTTDRLEALRALQKDAVALADKAKAAGLDAAAVDQLAAQVTAGLTEAAVKTRAPDSWRVTVRRWALVPVDAVVEVIGDDERDARNRAESAAESALDGLPDGASGWQRYQDIDGGPTEIQAEAIAAEPVWDMPPAKVEPEPAEPMPEPQPFDPEPEEPVKADEPVRIGPEPIEPAPKDDGVYEAGAVRSR